MENQDKIYFVSKGGGQYFKRQGNRVTIACTYDFNPSIERTTYDEKIISALDCRPCPREDFESALEKVLGMLDIPVAA
jgi:hypothetical protein